MASSIFEAAANGDIGSMNTFMDVDDFDIDSRDGNGCTALHCAARNGEAAAGGLLVECDANVDLVDNEGNTALMIAGMQNKRLVASMLLWGGCDRKLVNAKGNTALHEAAAAGAQDVAWLIVENGGEDTVAIKNKEGQTPLDLASSSGNQELIEMLEKSFEEVTKNA